MSGILKIINDILVKILTKGYRIYYLLSGEDKKVDIEVEKCIEKEDYYTACILLDRYFRYNDALNLAHQYKDKEPMLYELISFIYIRRKNYKQSFETCEEGYDSIMNFYNEYHIKSISPIEYDYYFSAWKLGFLDIAREKAWIIKTFSTTDEYFTKLRGKANADFAKIDNDYIKNLHNYPFEKRKVLLFVDKYTTLSSNHLTIINIHKFSNQKNIQLTNGYPIINQLYIVHPYSNNKYFLLEDYELELLEDKLREYCYFAQCLGAKEIIISCDNNNSQNEYNKYRESISGEINYKARLSASANEELSNNLLDEIGKSMNLHQRFSANINPHLPEGLVWYNNEPSWQRLYYQRKKGGLLEHRELISINKNKVIEKNELYELSAELEFLNIGLKGSYVLEQYNKKCISENLVLSIDVLF